jgi:hypothetical protein
MAMMEANKLNQEQATAAAIARREQESLAKERSVQHNREPEVDSHPPQDTTDKEAADITSRGQDILCALISF